MPNDKNKAAARVPNTWLMYRKVTAFALAGIATDALTFWTRQLSKMACPSCGVVGSLRVSLEMYGTETECRRGDRGLCDYTHEQFLNPNIEVRDGLVNKHQFQMIINLAERALNHLRLK